MNKILSAFKSTILQAFMALACISMSVSTFAASSFAELEVSSGGHLGVSAMNTANKKTVQYQAEERFPFCSTFKVMLVADILKESMTDTHLLEQKITYTKQELDASGYAPITQNHLADGMTIRELCRAAIMFSDNGAANLLMKKLGGPQAVTAFARSIGDEQFRLDRYEPELNSGIPGDLRDTTTPAVMEKSLQKLALGTALGSAQCEQLLAWMKGNTTGDARIRAGVTKGWLVADKTGSGHYGITNDIGVIWSPEGTPIVITIYFIQDKKESPCRDDVVAEATRIALSKLMEPSQTISK